MHRARAEAYPLPKRGAPAYHVDPLRHEGVQCQAQCTYTSLRHWAKPCFEFLKHGEDGAYVKRQTLASSRSQATVSWD